MLPVCDCATPTLVQVSFATTAKLWPTAPMHPTMRGGWLDRGARIHRRNRSWNWAKRQPDNPANRRFPAVSGGARLRQEKPRRRCSVAAGGKG